MTSLPRPPLSSLLGRPYAEVPAALQRVFAAATTGEYAWVGPKESVALSSAEAAEYRTAHDILKHIVIQGPTKHKSGHPGGPLSAFTFAYYLTKRRDFSVDVPLYYSAGHLSMLAYALQWLFNQGPQDPRLQSPQAIIDTFRIPNGLPGHVEAGIGDIPFGTGPLGKGVSLGVGRALGHRLLQKPGRIDVLLADGDAQEGQVMEAVRLAPALGLGNLFVHGDFNDVQLSGQPSRVAAADFAAMVHASGWNVIEVQNGNDPAQVVSALSKADAMAKNHRPTFLCYYTTMGNGLPLLEQGSNDGTANYHGSPLKDDVAAELLKTLPSLEVLVQAYEPARARYAPTPQSLITAGTLPAPPVFARSLTSEKGAARTDFGAKHLLAAMQVDPRIYVLHADLAGSGGFDKVAKTFPDRVINVGVAEANMLMMAAGMRQAGLLPVTYTFAAFATNEARASARLIDINCGHTPAGILNDATHTGLSVGEDGETHQERHYLNVPFDHTQVWMPADSNQSAAAAERALALVAEGSTSVYTFYPRSGHPQILKDDGTPYYGADYTFTGAADVVRSSGAWSDRATIVACGIPVHDALVAAQELLAEHQVEVRVLNVACIRPLDAAAITRAALETRHLIVVEDHSSEGGLATQAADLIADLQLPCSLRRLGVNQYYPSATADQLKFMAGLDSESIVNAVLDEIRHEVRGGEEALVSVLFALPDRLQTTRFAEKLHPYVQDSLRDSAYLHALRNAWAATSTPAALPTVQEILTRLANDTH